MKPAGFLLVSVVCASLGQTLFKKGLLIIGEITLKGSLLKGLTELLSNPYVLSGLCLYGISTIVWLVALSRTTLSFAFPFTALVFVLVMLSARLVFHEAIPTVRYMGLALICIGFLLCSLS